MGICESTFFQNLQQNVKNIRMCFLDFIKKDDGVWMSANEFGELSRIILMPIGEQLHTASPETASSLPVSV